MSDISNSELALLSLIIEKPRHAYEIEQVIEERNMRYWTEIGFSSIYRLLTKLERAGLLSGEIKPPEGKGPARKVYHLTPDGEETWRQTALQNLAKPEQKYSPFLLGLDNLGALPPKEVQQAVNTNLSNQQSVYQQLSLAIKNHPLREDFFIGIFFDYILNQLSSEIEWLQKLSEQLEKYYRTVE